MKKTITTILSSFFISAALLVSGMAQGKQTPTPKPTPKEPAKVKEAEKEKPKPTPTPKKKGDS